jgi:uncharacterized repeat protein (TIGR03803 family)
MAKLCGWNKSSAVFIFCVATAILSSARTFTSLLSFDGTNGNEPGPISLVQGTDGNFYGTTTRGGTNLRGTVFRVTPSGTLTTLYNFCSEASCADGGDPTAGLVLATDGTFYGTTSGGGAYDEGTVFNITSAGALTTLYSFCAQTNCTDGSVPAAALIQASDGSFYGTTFNGGTGRCTQGCGTVFKITSAGTLTTLHSFDGPHGADPEAALVQDTDGSFYGTTPAGGYLGCGGIGCGTVFKIASNGTLTTLHRFGGGDGSFPTGALVRGNDGLFYGVTTYGGSNFCSDGCGTIFTITAEGAMTTLYSFTGHSTDGDEPISGLIQATNGLFYGTTEYGYGTIYKVSTGGKLAEVFAFDGADGSEPFGGLLQGTDGAFYGTTNAGGTDNDGTVFSLALGLGPFVGLINNSGIVGQAVGILGQGFTGTNAVSFNGTPASFNINSDTYVTATVPTGATRGLVAVTMPGGTLTSNQQFRVTPQVLSFTPTSGPIGTPVTIIGLSLTQTKGVGFGDHVPASFQVNSDTQVTATVPAGAKTGLVGVETLGGIGISTTTFTVTQ